MLLLGFFNNSHVLLLHSCFDLQGVQCGRMLVCVVRKLGIFYSVCLICDDSDIK